MELFPFNMSIMPRFLFYFCTLLWNLDTNLSSSNSIKSSNIFYVAFSSVKFVIVATIKLGTMNYMGSATSIPYTNLKGVWPINLLNVVLHSNNTIGSLWSQSSHCILQIFVNAVSKILLNASTIPFSYKWYGVLL